MPSMLCSLALSVFSLTLIFSLMVVAGVGGPACYLLSTYRLTFLTRGRAINSPVSASETFALFLPNFKPF